MKVKKKIGGFFIGILGILMIIGFIPSNVSATVDNTCKKFSAEINFIVDQTGDVEPGQVTLELDLARTDGKTPEELGINFDTTEFTISGIGNHMVALTGEVDPRKVSKDNGWITYDNDNGTLYSLSFGLSQKAVVEKGWVSPGHRYGLTIYYDIRKCETSTVISEYGNDVYYDHAIFVNEYNIKQGNVMVKKADENGKPLKGAVFTLTGEDAAYEVVSDENGVAVFSVIPGVYTIAEKTAPEGYEKSDETYIIEVWEDGFVCFYNDIPGTMVEEYTPVTFVNKKIPEPKKPEPKKPEPKKVSKTPVTGDEENPILPAILLIGGAAGVLTIERRKRKQ